MKWNDISATQYRLTVEQRRGKENERIEMESTKSGEKMVFRKIKWKKKWTVLSGVGLRTLWWARSVKKRRKSKVKKYNKTENVYSDSYSHTHTPTRRFHTSSLLCDVGVCMRASSTTATTDRLQSASRAHLMLASKNPIMLKRRQRPAEQASKQKKKCILRGFWFFFLLAHKFDAAKILFACPPFTSIEKCTK